MALNFQQVSPILMKKKKKNGKEDEREKIRRA